MQPDSISSCQVWCTRTLPSLVNFLQLTKLLQLKKRTAAQVNFRAFVDEVKGAHQSPSELQHMDRLSGGSCLTYQPMGTGAPQNEAQGQDPPIGGQDPQNGGGSPSGSVVTSREDSFEGEHSETLYSGVFGGMEVQESAVAVDLGEYSEEGSESFEIVSPATSQRPELIPRYP
eukprot:gene7651-808_t